MQNMQYSPQPGGRRSRSFADLTGIKFDQRHVEFVIPTVDRDQVKGMYLTAALAERHGNPIIREMVQGIQAFFGHLNKLLCRARTGDQLALFAARKMVTNLPEAYEIGFGYAASGWTGSGVGHGDLNSFTFESLFKYPELSLTCVAEPDALAFIPRVDIDRVSDVFATIAKRHLIEYTVEQANKYGFDSGCMMMRTVENVWDPSLQGLTTVSERLPGTDDGRVILLVDKRIVRSAPPVRAHQYTRVHYGSGIRPLTKAEVLEDSARNPGRLLEAMQSILGDDWRFRPRRDFQ